MVNLAPRLWIAVTLGLFAAAALPAKELAAYQVGETAEADITASVALDVIDPEATAARRADEAFKIPAIFREFPVAMTNALTQNFSSAFAAEHAAFLAALKEKFQLAVLNQETIDSPDFEKFLAGFNAKKNSFPVSTELAGLWARGDSDAAVQGGWLDSLLAMTHRAIRADDLPPGFVLGETARIVTADPAEKLSLAAAERRGRLFTQANITSLSRLQSLFRRGFPDDQQGLARALQGFLQPNCAPDSELTQQARTREVSQLVVIAHFEAGQVLVHRGETIDAKIKAALAQLNDKLMPAQLNQQLAAEREKLRLAGVQAQIQAEQTRIEREHARQIRERELASQSQVLQARIQNAWLIVAFTGAAVLALAAGWWFVRRRRPAPDLSVARVEDFPALSPNFAPQLAEILKEAVVQGLATQRNELLQAQQAAAMEIAELVRRLDKLHAPVQERFQAYESRIGELEKELAARSEENQELLKIKIELMRGQLAAERAATGPDSAGFRYATSLRGKSFS